MGDNKKNCDANTFSLINLIDKPLYCHARQEITPATTDIAIVEITSRSRAFQGG